MQASVGFLLSPFDLHVLGTPPAFILSQDQTLMLMFFPLQINLAFLLLTFFTVLGLYSAYLSASRSLKFFLEFSGSHYCLFVKVLFTSRTGLPLPLVLLLSSAATLIE